MDIMKNKRLLSIGISNMKVCCERENVMYVMDRLKAKNADFGKLFHEINMSSLAQAKKERRKGKLLSLNVKRRRFAAHFKHS